MGATKFEVYTQKQIEYAKFFKALGHPARIAALENLMKAIEHESGFEELFDGIDLAQSTKSQHLKKLIEVGIVRTKLISNDRKSCLRYRVSKEAIEFVKQFLEFIHDNIDWDNNNYLGGNFYSSFHPGIDFRVGFQT